MAWNLEIHTIDVAQGESSLLVASNEYGTTYSMLIDGGLAKYGRLVDHYVRERLEKSVLDVIVTTHYDRDHSGGHVSIFQADNLSVIAWLIGSEIANSMRVKLNAGGSRYEVGIAGAAAFTAVIAGAYFDGVNDCSGVVSENVALVLDEYARSTPRITSDSDAIIWGFKTGIYFMQRTPTEQLNASLMRIVDNGATYTYGVLSVDAALKTPDSTKWEYAASSCFFEIAAPPSPLANLILSDSFENYNFQTLGFYRNTRVYNPGKVPDAPVKDLSPYFNALDGILAIGVNTMVAPNIRRKGYVVPRLGDELLGIADPEAPKVYCVAVGGYVYNNRNPIVGDAANALSIGLIVVFNQFAFFTGGDLPVDGLDKIPKAVNDLLGRTVRIQGFKTGHHGSIESNSQAYLDATQPRSAIISVGSTSFGGTLHPSPEVTTMLGNFVPVTYFYLTNCKNVLCNPPVVGVNGPGQLIPTNKTRISGDNHYDPGERPGSEAKVNRGHIVLEISQAQSQSTNTYPIAIDDGDVYRGYGMTYWEEDSDPNGGMDTPTGTVTEMVYF
jgi:beta-lactamase superfamily II metal-dependent hydrolase